MEPSSPSGALPDARGWSKQSLRPQWFQSATDCSRRWQNYARRADAPAIRSPTGSVDRGQRDPHRRIGRDGGHRFHRGSRSEARVGSRRSTESGEPPSPLGENEIGDEDRGGVVHRRLDVRIGLQCDRDVGVAQMLLHYSRMDAVGGGDRRPGVSQTVRRQIRHLVLANSPPECLVDALRVERAAVGLAEDES
jgi:hypothetical protein